MSALTTTLKDISHKFVVTNGVKLHYVEMGAGPTVVFLHGFPDFWYSFRYQIPALVAAGFHVVVPDLRGYGDSDIPASAEKYTLIDIVGDIVGLIESLPVKQVLLVGHDWGFFFAWEIARMRPDLLKGLVILGPVMLTQTPHFGDLPQIVRDTYGDKHYFWVFQEPGKAEALLGKKKTAYVLKAFLTRWSEDPKVGIPKVYSDEEEAKRPLPDWLTEEDLEYYAQTFDKTGFTGGLNYYRNVKRSWELRSPFASLGMNINALVINSENDINVDGEVKQETTDAEKLAEFPSIKGVISIPGGHFMHQEQHELVNKLILDFFSSLKDE